MFPIAHCLQSLNYSLNGYSPTALITQHEHWIWIWSSLGSAYKSRGLLETEIALISFLRPRM